MLYLACLVRFVCMFTTGILPLDTTHRADPNRSYTAFHSRSPSSHKILFLVAV
jgi:hypothetical protein